MFRADALRLDRTRCDVGWTAIGRGALPGTTLLKRRHSGGAAIRGGLSLPNFAAAELAVSPPSGLHVVAQSSDALSVAVEFALHLRKIRDDADAVVITSQRPIDDERLLGFPHLVAVVHPPLLAWDALGDRLLPFLVLDEIREDLVLWEVMPRTRLAKFAISSGTVDWWREHLEGALRLRRSAVAGAMGPAASAALAGRYVSFKFICEHDAVMRDELARLKAP